MKYICNNKEQYLLSLAPVSNNFDIKYLFINELKESIKISEDITILVNKENRNDDVCSIMIQDKINVENYVDEKLKHQNDFSYTLIAINVHLGSNNSGHYKAQIFNKNKWYLYDDGNCQEISEDERKQGVTYIYQRNPTPSKIIK